jgi:hypothetical protein
VVRANVSASLVDSVAVVDVRVAVEVTVMATADVMPVERARRAHHLESLLLSCGYKSPFRK